MRCRRILLNARLTETICARELHATAEELGFEHADSRAQRNASSDLRSAGTESPSGRLVIDLADAASGLRRPREFQPARTQSLSKAATVPLSLQNVRPEFNRVSVPLEKPKSDAISYSCWRSLLIVDCRIRAGGGALVAWRRSWVNGVTNSNAGREP